MRKTFAKYTEDVQSAENNYNINIRKINFILYYPGIIIILFSSLLVLPATRSIAKWMLLENRPVELLTFIAFILAAIFGFKLAFNLKKLDFKTITFIFFAFFSLSSLFVGMEEISWGQSFFGFDTPLVWKDINVQGETTIHNINGLQSKSQFPDLFFGLAGLFGIWLSKKKYYPYVHVPNILIPSFIIITIMAILHILHDDFKLLTLPVLSFLIRQLDELTELIIAITCFLFIWLNLRMLKKSRSGGKTSML